MKRYTRVGSSLLLFLGILTLAASLAEARVVRFVVEQRQPYAGGAEWGTSGAYERLVGTASMEVNPRDPLNAVIVDVDKAPRNARGMVEFATPFIIVKPVDTARGNHKIYYTVNNRANTALTAVSTAAQVSRAIDFALQRGYTLVDAGWEGDVVPTAINLPARLPIATQPDGSPIVGLMRIEYSPPGGTFTVTLKSSPAFTPYETADTDTTHATFTVRDDVNAPKIPIPSNRWAYGRCPAGPASFVPSTVDLCYFDGFVSDKLYELIYPAKNPIVLGLGHATTRDVASFLRYQTRDDAGNPNPLGPSPGHAGIRRAYATGASQTGGYLRDFIYLGFNEDESHRKVFDGIIPTIAGTDRVFINVRFADPNVFSDQDRNHDFLQNSFPPFTYAVTTDPISGIHDGIMKRPATDPLVFQIDSASEFWQLHGSLNVADGFGRPVPLSENVRLYFNSSTAHGNRLTGLLTAPSGQSALCVNPTPGGAVIETARALLVAMDEWAEQGSEPPKSNYPRLENGTLISLAEARAAFPTIPGVSFPTVMNEYELLDFGPEFGPLGGVLTLQPPRLGPSYMMFVPKTDKDGLDIAGIRPLQIRVPLATNTGWNVRAPGHRAPNLCGLTGSVFSFPETRAERLAAGDPRKSVEERYRDHDGFVKAVEKAAKHLVHERFLLEEDADTFNSAAEASDVLR